MQDTIRKCFERNSKALALRPSVGRGTATTRVRLAEGLACEIEDGPWKLQVDLSPKAGGRGGAPDPGVLGRGALGSCLTVAIALWAARSGVQLDALAVEVEADYDAGGMYGVGDAIADYSEIRYRVTVDSPASDEEVHAVIRDAEEHCNYLNVFERPRKCRRKLVIERSA